MIHNTQSAQISHKQDGRNIRNNLTDNEANDGEKVNLFYLKLKIFILIIYKINKYLKSVFTLNA